MFRFYTKANRELLEFYAVRILKGLLWGGVNSLEIDLMLCKETTDSSTSGQMCWWPGEAGGSADVKKQIDSQDI